MAASAESRELSAAELGAVAHLYRGEVYRSTIWRTRLDHQLVRGHARHRPVAHLREPERVAFAARRGGFLVLFFLLLEARRYRYFNVWRARCRWMERHLYAPMLDGGLQMETGWQRVLARDYREPRYHIGLLRAVGRRLRNNYI
jgi:uncharacterized membrane protein